MDNLDQNLLEMRDANIGRLFQRAARAYSERALALLHQRGYTDITLFHTALISNLDVVGTRITELADRAGMTKQAMGQLARELETKGYITRMQDAHDKRAVLVEFTQQGQDFLRVAYEVKGTIEREYAQLLGEDEVATLHHLLKSLVSQVT